MGNIYYIIKSDFTKSFYLYNIYMINQFLIYLLLYWINQFLIYLLL